MWANGENARSEQQELIDELRRRFPLIERLVGHFGHGTQEERIPWFFALLLSAAVKGELGACCFVLDKTRGTTAVAAVLLALAKLQENFPILVNKYAQTAHVSGQHVRVKPSNYVYEYSGVWEEHPEFFRLKVLGEGAYYRSFPMAHLLRLEPTSRSRPKGTQGSCLGSFERSTLDKLLDLTTCGNNSLICNSVLLFMAQAQFAEVIDAVTLAPEHANEFHSLSDILPWGSIGPGGELKPNDPYQLAGEPIIAVTRVPEDLALASSASGDTKVVLVDGARGLTRDIQAFDDIVDQQRVIILASSEETEALDLLRDRECPIWHISPNEILIGETFVEPRMRASFVGATIRAANTRKRAKVTVVDRHDTVLQTVAESLERAAALVANRDEVRESEEIVARLYGILLECSECCFGVSEDTKASLQSVQDQLTQQRNWLDKAVTSELEEAIRQLENFIVNGAYGQSKADELLNFILDGRQDQWIVAARSPRTAECLRTGFNDLNVDVPVFPMSAITTDQDYVGIIVPAWPNEKRFTRLRNQAVTPDIRILVYPFEKKWVSRHQAREHAQERSNRLSTETRASILEIDSRLLEHLTRHEPEPPSITVGLDPPIFEIERRVVRRRIVSPTIPDDVGDSREAQLVEFFGDCYALLTEWAKLPRLNQLIDGTNAYNAKLARVTVSKLAPGDFVLFRDSGDKEFIRLIAEEILGAEEYERVRTMAERWRSTLQRIGDSPADVQRILVTHGLNRTTVTVRGWLNDPERIGPKNFNDLDFIANAAGDTELLSIRKEVEDAIFCIRGAHISAGSQLTQLLLGELGGRLNKMDEQPVQLDLGYGKAWIVQVEMVEERQKKYPWKLVNRLLFTDDLVF